MANAGPGHLELGQGLVAAGLRPIAGQETDAATRSNPEASGPIAWRPRSGGRNHWRVERAKLEEYIAEAYQRTAQQLDQLPAEPSADT